MNPLKLKIFYLKLKIYCYLNGTSYVICPENCSSCIGAGQYIICKAGYRFQKSNLNSKTGNC